MFKQNLEGINFTFVNDHFFVKDDQKAGGGCDFVCKTNSVIMEIKETLGTISYPKLGNQFTKSLSRFAANKLYLGYKKEASEGTKAMAGYKQYMKKGFNSIEESAKGLEEKLIYKKTGHKIKIWKNTDIIA